MSEKKIFPIKTIIVRIMSTSVKGIHSMDAEINAESFEYVFFPVDQNGLCCAVFESWMLGYKHSVLSSKASQH